MTTELRSTQGCAEMWIFGQYFKSMEHIRPAGYKTRAESHIFARTFMRGWRQAIDQRSLARVQIGLYGTASTGLLQVTGATNNHKLKATQAALFWITTFEKSIFSVLFWWLMLLLLCCLSRKYKNVILLLHFVGKGVTVIFVRLMEMWATLKKTDKMYHT